MKPTLISVLGVILTHGGARAQTVTQPVDHSSVSAGAPVQVNCSYSFSGSPLLFWYVRYPGSSLQLLLGYTTGKSANGFMADLNKAETSFHLRKASAREEDSATYYCALSGTVPAIASEAEHKPLRSLRTFVSSLFFWTSALSFPLG